MYKFFLTVSLTVLAQISALAQATWSWVSPLPQGNTLRGVHYYDATHVAAVGDLGTLLLSSDGGKQWKVKHYLTGTSNHLHGVYFVDANTGFVVGTNGYLAKTTDGGGTWLESQRFTSNTLRQIRFLGSKIGFILESYGKLFKTTDGGVTWIPKQTNSANVIHAFSFADRLHGFIVGNRGTILRTLDGGETWFPLQSGATKNLLGVSTFDSLTCIAVGGNGLVLRTTDGGIIWERTETGAQDLFGAHYFTKDHIILSGGATPSGFAVFLTTKDGGNTWTQYLPEAPSLFALSCAQNTNLCAVGLDGTMLLSTDAGENWGRADTALFSRFSFSSIRFPTKSTGYITDYEQRILKTSDAGITWKELLFGNTTGAMLRSSSFPTENVGYLYGSMRYNNILAAFLRTSDGGATWSKFGCDSCRYSMNDIFAVGSTTCFMIADTGRMFKSTDWGVSWTMLNPLTKYSLTSMYFVDESFGFMTCNKYSGGTSAAILMRTTNGGLHWNHLLAFPVISGEYVTLGEVYFYDRFHGFVTSSKGIMRTNDGGDHWSEVAGTTAIDYSFVNPNIGIGVAAGDGALMTTDGGGSWKQQMTGAYMQHRSVAFINSTTALVVGEDGKILKATLDPALSVDDHNEKPTSFFLSQNFPNPFGSSIGSSTTWIEYTVPTSTDIQIFVHDTFGRKVGEVLSEWKEAGPYRIPFESKTLPCGVYILSMHTSRITLTKKMVIMN